jgi:leucine dehydrogenase
MRREHPDVEYVEPKNYFGLNVDVIVPCALGGVLNDESVPQIKAKVIAGTANNVLLDEDIHGNMIKDKGILYAPDFVINAGGLINVYHELKEYNVGRATRDIEKIYDRLLEIFKIADNENIHTQQAAKVFAKKRIETINNVQDNYIKR